MIGNLLAVGVAARTAAASRTAYADLVLGTAEQGLAGGPLPTRTSRQVQASHLSVGFETLDRLMFDPVRTYDSLAALGVKHARCQTGWARTEQQRGHFDFGWLEQVVDKLLSIGIQPWFNVGYGNPVYTPAADKFGVGWAPLFAPEERDAWVRYVDKLATTFNGRVQAWEIWNEPNNAGFWRPGPPNAKHYNDLVRLTAPVIRRIVPHATIVGGVYAGLPFDFIEAGLSDGLADLVDKVSYHPYRAVPEENYAAEMRTLRALIAARRKGIEIWQGENGAPSTLESVGALHDLAWTEERQAKWVLRRILTDLSLRIERTSYFHTVDLQNYNWGGGPSKDTNSKGLLRGGTYTQKPSYAAYQNVCALFDTTVSVTDIPLFHVVPKSVDLRAAAVTTAAFQKNGIPLYVFWMPTPLQEDARPQLLDLSVWHPPEMRLRSPVLIDLLRGTVRDLPASTGSDEHTALKATEVFDYPMLLTDRRILSP